MIAALFVQTNGVYFGQQDVDPWDEQRDARKYAGPHPVIAHPPCSAWCKMAPVNQKRWGRKVGDDGGCFASALASVRRWGGVLEHPAGSLAWVKFGLPKPRRGDWISVRPGEWVTEVSQSAYGHKARKRTWLLWVGQGNPPNLDWSEPTGIAWCCNNKKNPRKVPTLSKREACATPVQFRDLLILLASLTA